MRRPTLVLQPLDLLLPHESTVPSRVRAVAESIASLGQVLRPVIAEYGTLTVIDGHHRLAALRLLGARLAPVLLVDYEAHVHGIEARRYRIAAASIEGAADLIESMAAPGPHPLILRSREGEMVIYRDPLDAYQALSTLEGPGQVEAEPAPLEPRHVIQAAARGLLLPPRSTLHSTPAKSVLRPVPLRLLL